MNTTMKLTREEWMRLNPHLNPDYMTPLGLAWSLTPRQREALDRADNEQVNRDELRAELRCGVYGF